MGLSDCEASTLSVSLTTRLVDEVVAKEGGLADDDEVYKLLCLLSSSEAGLKTVTSLGGLVALSLLASKGKVSALQCLLAADAKQVIESEGEREVVAGIKIHLYSILMSSLLLRPPVRGQCRVQPLGRHRRRQILPPPPNLPLSPLDLLRLLAGNRQIGRTNPILRPGPRH